MIQLTPHPAPKILSARVGGLYASHDSAIAAAARKLVSWLLDGFDGKPKFRFLGSLGSSSDCFSCLQYLGLLP